MAMMAKMRSLAPAFIITIGTIFVLFMVLSDSKITEIFNQRSKYIGSVDGVNITYQEFANRLESEKQQLKAQSGKDLDEEYMDQFNDEVWDKIVLEKLVDEQVKKFGISVSDSEIREMVLGANPPEFLKRNFVDSTGKFHRDQYDMALKDKRNSAILLQIEESLRKQLTQSKLQSFVAASVPLCEAEIQQKYIDQNIKMSGEYVFINANSFADNAVSVNDDDLKKYYDDHINKYKVDAQRKVKYVLFQKTASHGDSVATKENLASIVAKAKGDTAAFKTYIEIYSERPYAKDTVKPNMLGSEAFSALSNAKFGDLIGPVATYEGYSVFKVLGRSSSKETFVRASHILIPSAGDDAKAKAQADAIYSQLASGADFAKLAMEKSSDPGSARNGGDLGWFGKGMMIKEFDEAAFAGKIGEIQKPVKTSFGYHIIKVTGHSSDNFIVEKIVNKVKASGSTIDNAFNAANDFSYLTKEKKYDFEGEAKTMKYAVHETPAFLGDAAFIPGLGANKSLVEFAFDNSLNDISKVFKTPAGYIVAKVSSVVKEGVKKFEEVKASLKPVVIRLKKFEKAKEIAEKISNQGGSLATAAASYPANARFDTTGTFTAQMGIPGIGRDYSVIDNALKMRPGKTSAPVKGLAGYYILKLNSKTPFDRTVYKIQRNSFRDNLLNEKRQSFFSAWIAGLKKNAEIVDNRASFYSK